MKKNPSNLLYALILVCIALSACSQQSVNQKTQDKVLATTLYSNADIVTMNSAQPSADGVVVHEGRILAVGSATELEQQFTAEVVDLNGATLLPGLIDAHGHISFTARTASAPNVASPPVGPAETIDDVISELKAYADRVPGESWIMGFGYDDSLLKEQRHPTKAELDLVSAERPIAITHVSGHLMSCNSKCLELADINAETADPEGGIIRRLEGGKEPDGVLEETAMYSLFKVIPSPSEEIRMVMLDNAQKYYAKHGITTVQDGAAQAPEIALLVKAAAEKRLMLDVVSFPFAGLMGDEISQVKASTSYQNHFRIGGIKLVLDGSPQGKTAWLTKPYLHPPHGQGEDYAGYATMPDEKVFGIINTAFANGIPVLAHANGDAAADQLIGAVSAANKQHGKLDRRTVMIHAQTAREDQIDAMVQENIVPSYFSAHTFYWGDWHRDSVFGVERGSRISPLKSSLDKGLVFTTHNDTPIVPPDMMRLIWASVNRVTRSGKVLGAEQRVSPHEALKSITINAAYQYFEEDQKGSIEVGKLADFTVVDKNPLKIDPLLIKDIKILKTIKEGNLIYSAIE